MTDGRANVRYPNPATKKQPFTRKQHSRWLYESTLPESLVFPGTSTVAIQVPNHTQTALCSPPHKWQITSGLIIKNQRWPEGVVVERRGAERGAGEPNKAFWASADKERHISPGADHPKEFIWITNGCRLEARLSPTKRSDLKHGFCAFAWTVGVLLLCDLAQKRGNNIVQGDKNKPRDVLLCRAPSFVWRLWNTIMFTSTPPLPVSS